MSGRVEQMIQDGVRALVERDRALAERTIAADAEVNRTEVELDAACMALLSAGRPDADTVRFVTGALRMGVDLERIGDLAVNICERVLDMKNMPTPKLHDLVLQMAKIVQDMVRQAIDGLITKDPEKAKWVLAEDDRVDDLYVQCFDALLERMRSDPGFVRQGIHFQSVAKWLERMADHSTNLAEQVIYVLLGEDVRFGQRRPLDDG